MCWHACFWRYCLCILDYISANITLLNFRCKCGNCNVALLQNISECYCCCELEGCEESIKSDLVLQDLAPDVNLTCVTEHPGFQPVCLQKWSLRLAADKFKTKGKERYRQTGSEERWGIFTTVLVGVIPFRVYQKKLHPSFQVIKFEVALFIHWHITNTQCLKSGLSSTCPLSFDFVESLGETATGIPPQMLKVALKCT